MHGFFPWYVLVICLNQLSNSDGFLCKDWVCVAWRILSNCGVLWGLLDQCLPASVFGSGWNWECVECKCRNDLLKSRAWGRGVGA